MQSRVACAHSRSERSRRFEAYQNAKCDRWKYHQDHRYDWGPERLSDRAVVTLRRIAREAGEKLDKNLIELPANEAAQAKLAGTKGFILPIHKSSHSDYDWTARGVILLERAKYGKETVLPAQARAIFEKAAIEMKAMIIAGRWMPKLR